MPNEIDQEASVEISNSNSEDLNVEMTSNKHNLCSTICTYEATKFRTEAMVTAADVITTLGKKQ
jgi:hypothetical protein